MANQNQNRTAKPEAESRPKPVKELRLGRVKAAIWGNETQDGVRFNVTLTRLYKDGDSWKRSESFGRDDLLLVAKVAEKAAFWIFEETQEEGDGNVPF